MCSTWRECWWSGRSCMLLMHRFGHYYVQGVGYATIQDVLSGLALPAVPAPSAVCRQAAGHLAHARFGRFGRRVLPRAVLGSDVRGRLGRGSEPLLSRASRLARPHLRLREWARVVGGSTGAAMAAIVMIFEMTLDYTVIIPMTLTVAISYGVRRSLIKDSIYTRKLTLRGESVPETMRADVQLPRRRGAHHASGQSGSTRCIGGGQRRRLSRRLRHGGRRRVFMGRRSQDAGTRRLGRAGYVEGRTIRRSRRPRE